MEDTDTTAPAYAPAPLTAVEARIIGCLIEKEITLPDYYPLTLNSLVTACNQSSNRDPIMSLDEGTVQRAVENLKSRGWIFQVTVAGARVQKFRHNVKGKLPRLEKPSLALLAVLLLRGVQTAGELRQRVDRMQTFPDLESVESELTETLINYPEGAVATCLPSGPGRRVAQYAQLLTGEPSTAPAETIVAPAPAPVAAPVISDADREWKERMEIEIQLLKAQLARLKSALGVED